MTRRQPATPPRPPKKPRFHDRQQRFIAEYLKDLNATQAAIRAGYSPRTAQQQSVDLLSRPLIKAAVAKATAAQLKSAELSAALVLEAIRRQVVGDVRALFDTQGNHRPITDLTEEEAALVAGYEVIIKNAKAGDGKTDEVLKVKLTDRSRYVEMAAKHFKLLHDMVSVEGDWDKFAARLASAKLRMQPAEPKA